MSSSLKTVTMTRDEFLAWAPADDRRYEFDGSAPVAMTGGTRNHARIAGNVQVALQTRLRGTPCEALSQDAGLATVGEAIRYPDVLVTCTRGPGSERLISGVVVVFEVLSPSSGRTDRIEKLLEYRAVPTIRRYVILEDRGPGLTVFEREPGVLAWTASALGGDDVLHMPEIGICVPVAEFYERVEFPTDGRWPVPDEEDDED